ncbi:hypothetical protein [Peribacillus loiseleuriae]|uniref:Uncharacterized protein n=1 Tax=Peribacillus loiseleuriae TaxID=1679170 RepID=A0A0K9GSF6_9BACI|nr:hypothetical protein [Peribacillus loiseleuriae]KMY49541.1 hypothetical protein AC625_08275 [Peribacillus loiseleuriae]
MVLTRMSFLPEDNKSAVMEYRCINTCYSRIEESVFKGDFEEAKRTTRDLLNSIREIERLHERKKKLDRKAELVRIMAARGIHIELVVRTS